MTRALTSSAFGSSVTTAATSDCVGTPSPKSPRRVSWNAAARPLAARRRARTRRALGGGVRGRFFRDITRGVTRQTFAVYDHENHRANISSHSRFALRRSAALHARVNASSGGSSMKQNPTVMAANVQNMTSTMS